MENAQLDRLLTYTTFHIGVYISLITAIIGAGILGKIDHPLFRLAAICFLISGVCGGVIGSNLPEFADYASFSQAKLGAYGLKLFNYKKWIFIEHTAFWIGVLPIALAYIFLGKEAFK
ncbi:MAG: hypothetical protein AAFW67_06615 [Cyanobacteria bacterium J06638_38]